MTVRKFSKLRYPNARLLSIWTTRLIASLPALVPVLEAGQDIREVALDHRVDLLDRREARPDRPPVPLESSALPCHSRTLRPERA